MKYNQIIHTKFIHSVLHISHKVLCFADFNLLSSFNIKRLEIFVFLTHFISYIQILQLIIMDRNVYYFIIDRYTCNTQNLYVPLELFVHQLSYFWNRGTTQHNKNFFYYVIKHAELGFTCIEFISRTHVCTYHQTI